MAESRRPGEQASVRARAWTLVLIAAVFEIAWAVGLPFTEGFTRPVPTLLVVAAMIAAFLPLAKALQVLPVGPAYATWTGLGATGTAVLGLFVHGEPLAAWRLVAIAMVVTGVVGLRLADAATAEDHAA